MLGRGSPLGPVRGAAGGSSGAGGRLMPTSQGQSARAAPAAAPLPAVPAVPAVLVVEPYPALQQLLLRLLETEGLPAHLLRPEQALGWLTAAPARLLLLDIDLPDPPALAQA